MVWGLQRLEETFRVDGQIVSLSLAATAAQAASREELLGQRLVAAVNYIWEFGFVAFSLLASIELGRDIDVDAGLVQSTWVRFIRERHPDDLDRQLLELVRNLSVLYLIRVNHPVSTAAAEDLEQYLVELRMHIQRSH